jgi:uncharacterized membrane protein YdbT with pleckstrin-like domain
MELQWLGLVVGLSVFVIIGLFHPVVIWTEYYTGTRFWWVFLVLGILALGVSVLVTGVLLSCIAGAFSFCCFWTIKELFEQKERVKKGWFPKRPEKKK